MKEKIVYEEGYKKGAAVMNKDSLPILNHLNDGFEVEEAHLLKAGLVERNGKEQEFQVIKVYLKELD